ncbi:hypothetical protein DLAC_08221 [Tieghemostelium lacteum]|uniref:Uncharacterized protein n=1 Tax=Tieghemostelium lacteum TaxID=361077 RepID=A0A151ZBH1_TIELA|nr:hypothetical protein DLAC_08221 [Tieghemostelium lacteum]|eukprot:KYQ91281.1 hypothetical protein DLAC_08221 [Tieghemostelium lacteum]
MSDSNKELKNDSIEDDNYSDQSEEEETEKPIVEEEPKVWERSQNDHINKHLLSMFKNRINSGHQVMIHNDDNNSESDDEFKDSENELYELEEVDSSNVNNEQSQ